MAELEPETADMTWYGAKYHVDLQACRDKIVRRLQAEACLGKEATLGRLSQEAGLSRMTLYRFLQGHQVALTTFNKILGTCNLQFEDVARPALRSAAA